MVDGVVDIMTADEMTPPSSPTKHRKQVIQPWWILAFAFVQTVVFVYISEALSDASEIRSRLSFSVARRQKKAQSPDVDDLMPSIQRHVRSLEVGRMLMDVDARLQELEGQIQKKLNASLVTACQRFQRIGTKVGTEDICKEGEEPIVAFNPASYQRIWCGTTVPAKGFVLLTKLSCQQPPRMFPTDPTVDGTGMPAIHVEPYMPHIILPSFRNKKRNVTDFECDIPCKKTVGGEVFSGTDYRIVGTDLKILHSLESSQYYGNLHVKDDAYLENQFYSTTSFRSEIPVPYYSIEHGIAQPSVQYDDAIRGATFIARNCNTRNNREDVVRELMNFTKVDALSSCLHNAEPPNGLSLDGGQDGKKKLMGAYLFNLAFENSQEDDYITEKLWGALESGTLPVYYGAPNVKEHAPPNSIISWHDFSSTKELAGYINKVAANKTLYDSYHEWRSKPLPEPFRRKFEFTQTHSICRICRFAYAKKYGLGFDHGSQTVEDLVISRQVSYDSNGKVNHPFREISELPGDGWKRTVWEHDGVIDLHFETLPQSNSEIYRMETAVRGDFHELESNVFIVQNGESRITILTSWDADVVNTDAGTVDILLEPSFAVLRLRVLVEDLDTFHKGADKLTNYFGSLMTKDFFAPMEAFLVVGGNLSMLPRSNRVR